MISGIRGTLQSKSADHVLVATDGGITYELAVPIGVLEQLPDVGGQVALQTVLVVREDGWALFGFDQGYERDVFQRLLGTSGVGPRLALALVSALGGARVVRSVREADIAALCTVPGVGKKTAERIVLELKDRLRDVDRIHVSLDMDGLDPSEAPGVGTPVPGGLTYREAHLLMEILGDSGQVNSLDVVEINPILDMGNKTAELAIELVASLLGQRIM